MPKQVSTGLHCGTTLISLIPLNREKFLKNMYTYIGTLHIHTYIHTYIHAYIIHICMHTYIHRPRLHESKTSNFLSNFLLLSENYESLAHEIDPAEPEEDTDSVKEEKIA